MFVIGSAERFEVAEGIEQFELIARLQQRIVLALAVDVDEDFAESAERGEGDRLFVDVRLAAPGAVQLAGEDELAILDGLVEDAFDGGFQVGADEFEHPGDAKFIRAGADEVGAAAIAEEQAERTEEQ